MNNFDALKRMNEEQIADLIMQFLWCAETQNTSKEAIIEWLKGNSMYLPFTDTYLGETE